MPKIVSSNPTFRPPSSPGSEVKSAEEIAVESALLKLYQADATWHRKDVDDAKRALAEDPEFKALIDSVGTVENAANALAVAMTYLASYPSGPIEPENVATKIVGHVGATTAISRTYVNTAAAMKDEDVRRVCDRTGITQTHVVTGPGHGAAAIFGLLFLEGTLAKIYPDRYPVDAKGLQNLIADFCRPKSPLPSHVFPGVPSVSEGGELGYSMGIAAGAAMANPDALIVAQIGDKEAESGPLQACIENHNAVYDFRKGLVLPVVHANGLGISGSSIISGRSDSELKLYLRGLGYAPFIIDAEDSAPMRQADKKSAELEVLLTAEGPKDDAGIAALRSEIQALRSDAAELTNAIVQRYTRQGIYNLAKKKELALALDSTERDIAKLESKVETNPKDQLASKRLGQLKTKRDDLTIKLRNKRTPLLVYREAKGGGHAPAFVHGQPAKGAPMSHQVILKAKDLMSTDPSTRNLLDNWLKDLTGGEGVDGLLPQTSANLGAATRTAFPQDSLLPGRAPLAVGRAGKPLAEQSVDTFMKPLTDAGRGAETRGSNDLIDSYLAQYLDANRGDAYLLSADTAESNRLKQTITTLGRRYNLDRGENHPTTSGPGGDAVDVLSEQYLMAMAQGMVNSGKQAVISNYEAFHHVASSMVRQFTKFRKQATEANATAKKFGHKGDFRPPVPNLVLHLSSLAFAQDHNGFSHQNPGLLDDLVSEPRAQVSVYMPPEANTAVAQMDKAVDGKGKVVALIADKQPRAQFLSPQEATNLAEVGAARWDFASSVQTKPDVVLAASGGYHTDEVLAATQILGAFNEKLEAEGKRPVRYSTVNVAEPLKLRGAKDKDDVSMARLSVLGRTTGAASVDATVFDDKTFGDLFPDGVPIVYNFGGFKRTIDSLFSGRGRKVSGHGYSNEGSTTTRFDMMTLNHCDRYSVVVDAVEQAYARGGIDRQSRDRIQSWCAQQLRSHDGRMQAGEYIDPKSIAQGVWTAPDLAEV